MKLKAKRILSTALAILAFLFGSLGVSAQSLAEKFYQASSSEMYEKVPDTVKAKSALLMDLTTTHLTMHEMLQ